MYLFTYGHLFTHIHQCLLPAWLCLLSTLHISASPPSFISHYRYLCSSFSSPVALLPHSFTTALFTLFKILPLSSPPPISCPFSLFFALTNSLFSIPSPFLSPLEPTSPLYPPYVFPVSLSSSVLRCSCCLCWQSGRRRRSETKLAALAPCIIHVPCSLCESRSLLAFHWDIGALWISTMCGAQGLLEELHRWDYQFLHFCTLLLMKALGGESLSHRSTFKCKMRWFPYTRSRCLLSVSTARLFTTKYSPNVFFSPNRGPARVSDISALMFIWKTCPLLLFAKLSACLAEFLSSPHQDSKAVLFAFRAGPARTVNCTGLYEILI